MQVTYLVQFIVGLVGELIQEIAAAIGNFGVTVTDAAGNLDVMVLLTNGIFGQNSGLIYWINNKVFYLISNMPWCDLGQGLGQLMEGLLNPPAC